METAGTNRLVHKLGAVIVVAIIVVAAAVVLVVFASPNSGSKASSHQASSSPPNSTESTQWTIFNSTTSPEGLQVQAWLNSTTVPVGRVLSATVFLFNTLGTNVSLTPDFSADSGLVALSGSNGCRGAGLDAMLNFALYQGRYTAANFTQAATPLMLDPQVGMSCPNPYYVSSYVHQVEFAPRSYNVTLTDNASYANAALIPQTVEMHMSPATGSCDASPYKFNGTSVVNSSTTTSSGTAFGWGCGYFGTGNTGLNGYWTVPANGGVSIDTRTNSSLFASFAVLGDYFHQFSPGSYTLVAEDLWNQTVFAHFEVVPPEPVEVLSVTGPIPAPNGSLASILSPGPMVNVDLKNAGEVPIVSLIANLGLVPPDNLPAQAESPSTGPHYPYADLGVNASNPLLPGHSAQETRSLFDGSFDAGVPYPLTISGTLANGTEFSYVVDVQIVPP
jgi:hypothetical protein